MSFGYNNLVVDMRAFPILRALGHPVIYDVTHSLQLPGGGDGVTAGQAEFIGPLASAGVAAGVDGVFLEVHERPEQRQERCAERAAARPPRAAARQAAAPSCDRAGISPIARRARQMTSSTTADLELARRVLRTEAAAILALVDRLDGEFERALQLLLDCRGRVIVTGMGKSGLICRKIAATLSSTGTSAFFLHPAEAIHGDLGAIRNDDVVAGGVAQRRDGRADSPGRGDQADGRATHRDFRASVVDAWPGRQTSR